MLIAENATRIPDLEVSGQKGTELSYAPIEIKSGDWILKVVPWVGGRILSMEHLPSGYVITKCIWFYFKHSNVIYFFSILRTSDKVVLNNLDHYIIVLVSIGCMRNIFLCF